MLKTRPLNVTGVGRWQQRQLREGHQLWSSGILDEFPGDFCELLQVCDRTVYSQTRRSMSHLNFANKRVKQRSSSILSWIVATWTCELMTHPSLTTRTMT